MKTSLNIIYGVLIGLIIITLGLTALASIMQNENLFGYFRFWLLFTALALPALFIKVKG